ncbi:hypothetical protein [Bacillus sp. FSL H8-0545]|uniref:hypothetical protein n=1 Tax=Bacillus sp. FSL H8-0545 TaxID=2921402 RepID=UPI004046AA2B
MDKFENKRNITTAPAEPKKEIKKEQPKQDVQQSVSGFTNPIKNIDQTAAMNAVKEKAKKDFPDDYMTQNYVAEGQDKAFDHLNGIELKSQEELNVMKNAIGDFPNDFMTTKYVYEEQIKAMNKQ